MVDKSVEAINKALLIILSSSVSLEAMIVLQLFADGKLKTTKLRDIVAQLCCVSDMALVK